MTSSRSRHLTSSALARFISQRTVSVFVASTLLVFVISGCGINIPQPQADSGVSEMPDDSGATPAMPMASAGGSSGMQADMSGAMESGNDPNGGMDPSTYGSPAGDPALDMEAEMAASMQSSLESDPSLDGDLSEEDMQLMMEENMALEQAAGADAELTPEQMAQMMQQELRGGQNPGAQNLDADAEEFQGEGGAGRGGRANQFEEGTPAHTVMLMVAAIDADDMETAAKYIDDGAGGLLGSVRDGDAGQNQLSQLQSYFATMDPISARPRGRSITLTFNGGQNKVLSFVVAKDGRDFVVDSLTVRDAQDRRGR